MQLMKVKCPRCSRLITSRNGNPDVICNCHLYCEDGIKPTDCNLVSPYLARWDHARFDDAALEHGWAGLYGWPRGMHEGQGGKWDDTQARTKFCTVHEKYTDKVPFLIECNWSRWYSRRAPKKMRLHHGQR